MSERDSEREGGRETDRDKDTQRQRGLPHAGLGVLCDNHHQVSRRIPDNASQGALPPDSHTVPALNST